MMNNNRLSSLNDNINVSITIGDEASSSRFSSDSSTILIIQIGILSVTSILAIAYIVLILIRPIFRHNKLNWFIINVCLTSIWLCIILLSMNIRQLLNVSNSLSCRLLGFLVDMGACQLMYSHCVIAISRLLTVVYGNKRLFLSNKCLWFCIAMGWTVGILAALPYLFVDGFLCSYSTSPPFLAYYTLITTLFLPITIVTVCNTRILLFVRNSTRRVHATGTVGHVSHTRDVQLLKITIGTFVAFVVGWTPAFTTQLFNLNTFLPTIVNTCFQMFPPLVMLHDVILLISTNQLVRIFVKQLFVRRPQVVQLEIKHDEHQPNIPNH